jgi:hypothetical protein
LEEVLASNGRILAELQNQTKNQKQIGDLEIWLAANNSNGLPTVQLI